MTDLNYIISILDGLAKRRYGPAAWMWWELTEPYAQIAEAEEEKSDE